MHRSACCRHVLGFAGQPHAPSSACCQVASIGVADTARSTVVRTVEQQASTGCAVQRQTSSPVYQWPDCSAGPMACRSLPCAALACPPATRPSLQPLPTPFFLFFCPRRLHWTCWAGAWPASASTALSSLAAPTQSASGCRRCDWPGRASKHRCVLHAVPVPVFGSWVSCQVALPLCPSHSHAWPQAPAHALLPSSLPCQTACASAPTPATQEAERLGGRREPEAAAQEQAELEEAMATSLRTVGERFVGVKHTQVGGRACGAGQGSGGAMAAGSLHTLGQAAVGPGTHSGQGRCWEQSRRAGALSSAA